MRVQVGLIKICRKMLRKPAQPWKFRTKISSISPHGGSAEAIFQHGIITVPFAQWKQAKALGAQRDRTQHS
jgi:hypothetical protein